MRAKKNGPQIIGLTGSIAMGKSTVAQMFEDEGVPVFDADAAVHSLQGRDGALLGAIEADFPGTTGSGGVDRQILGKAVFGDPMKLKALEAIIHPAVATMRAEFFNTHAEEPLLVFDIPLLFEKGGHESVDHIVVVSAPADQQRARALARPGMTPEKLDHILSIQTPDAEKRSRANFVIETGVSLGHTRAQVTALVKKLRESLAVSDKQADMFE